MISFEPKKKKIKVLRPKAWRVIFALDCHGGMVIEAETQEEALALFEAADSEQLMRNTQIQKARYMGIIERDDTGNWDEKWKVK